MVISDLQIPFEASRALDFCKYVQKHFKIPLSNIVCVGDELDAFHGSSYPKDPDALLSPVGEIALARDKIKNWGDAFSSMRIALSNHGLRWLKKASQAEIPSELMRTYQEVFQMPPGWKWQYQWIIDAGKQRFLLDHGMDLGGQTPYRQAAQISAISRVFGHLHSSAGVCHVRTKDKSIWAMNVGCLIDVEAYAFKYERDNKFKPCLGCGVILNGGTTPIWLPYS